MPPKAAKQVREKTNWLIHMLYIRQDYDQCLEKIEEALKGCNGMAECAPLPLPHTLPPLRVLTHRDGGAQTRSTSRRSSSGSAARSRTRCSSSRRRPA